MGQNRSDSLTGESKALPDNKKVPVTLLCAAYGADGVLNWIVCIFAHWVAGAHKDKLADSISVSVLKRRETVPQSLHASQYDVFVFKSVFKYKWRLYVFI